MGPPGDAATGAAARVRTRADAGAWAFVSPHAGSGDGARARTGTGAGRRTGPACSRWRADDRYSHYSPSGHLNGCCCQFAFHHHGACKHQW
jgi:hypothetical protein